MGVGPRGVGAGAKPPSHVAYFVALVGVLGLLLMLLCYFVYFCVKRVKELMQQDCSSQVPSSQPPPAASSYPIQPIVRDSASAMAKLCKQLPPTPAPARGTDTVFPTSTSPAARAAPALAATPATPTAAPPPPTIKVTAPVAAATIQEQVMAR